MKLAILYAGQGAQHPGMGKEFYEASSAFRAAFDAADLPFDLHRVCFDDPDGVLIYKVSAGNCKQSGQQILLGTESKWDRIQPNGVDTTNG